MSVLILAAELDITADRMVSVLKQREVPFARVDTQCGLAVPDTLVTNRAEAVRRFAERGETVA